MSDKKYKLKRLQIKKITTESQAEMNAAHNPLKIVINTMIRSKKNIKITALPTSLLQRILNFIGIDCMYEKSVYDYKSAIKNLICEIDLYHLTELLNRWRGWRNTDKSKQHLYNALYLYVKSHVLNFKLQRESFLLDELKNMLNFNNSIRVSCSFKQLQALFYHTPQNFAKFHPKNVFISSSQLKQLHPGHIIVCPFVSTQINVSNFSMTRQNNHIDEFTLLNITNGLNINKNKNMLMERKPFVHNFDKYVKWDIEKFLNQLKLALINMSGNLTIEKKAELILALTIFECDLAQCPVELKLNHEYSWSLAPYPYARYLGYSDNGDICMSMSDQKALKKAHLNVRLQQLRHPKTSIFLQNFDALYEIKTKENDYVFENLFDFCDINTCISYKCLLCDESLKSSSSDHFSNYHGLEPDWECTHCTKSFTNDCLLSNNWRHDCE